MPEVMISEIAGRIAAIIGGGYSSDIGRAAAELGIAEADLRVLVERQTARSTESLTEILMRIVGRLGVDPGWLVTGRYDVRSHIAAEENRSDPVGLRDQIRGLLRGPERPVPIEPVRHADVRVDSDDRRLSSRAQARPTGDERER